MADYSIWVLGEGNLSISGGTSLDSASSNDGSHLVGETITIDTRSFTEILISDAGSETNFADNDSGQRLNGDQTLDGVTYTSGTRIEAEYTIVLLDPNTGIEYTALAVNINEATPRDATSEALAFVDAVPPTGVELTVVSSDQGPNNGGPSAVPEVDIVPLCFCKGTLILTDAGLKSVETLKPGDLLTRPNGTSAVLRRVFHAALGADALARNPKLLPICISAGALGENLPTRDLYVSRQHRMLVTSKIAARMFGRSEVLVAAIKLTEFPGIYVDTRAECVDYFHLLLDDHEVILAEGAPTETLFTGPEALKAVDAEAREEILALFPDLSGRASRLRPARYIPAGGDQRQLVRRHAKNNRALLS